MTGKICRVVTPSLLRHSGLCRVCFGSFNQIINIILPGHLALMFGNIVPGGICMFCQVYKIPFLYT